MNVRRFYLNGSPEFEGVEFSDGTVVIRCCIEPQSTVIWSSIEAAAAIHSRDGSATVVWIDSPDDITP